MRSRFDEQLLQLNRELITMGTLCEEIIALAVKAAVLGDMDMAARVDPLEDQIDKKEREIETLCLRLLLQQQPVATDLRQISAALKMITDMERIGDQAKDIAEIARYLNGRTYSDFEHIANMGREAIGIVTDSITAFVKQDVNIAKEVIQRDDVIDDLFVGVKKSLLGYIANNPSDGEYAIDILMIAKYFERIGDHATNIAEWVVFSVVGDHGGVKPL